MPVYFASDMHLRLDRPERGERLARWVGSLSPADTLYLVGDVCDFWYSTRQLNTDPMSCEGLRSLAEFRSRGGTLVVLPGNHDLWMLPFYEQTLGAECRQEPLEIEVHGLRLHIVHGHRAGLRKPWKAAMESQTFFNAFRRLPDPMAHQLDRLLSRTNDRIRSDDDARHLAHYRAYLRTLDPATDIVVFGHVHSVHDDASFKPRLIVLGGWQRQSSFLRVDEQGATHVVVPDGQPVAI